MADDLSENYRKALAEANKLIDAQKKMNKSADSMKNSWHAISDSVFKISGAEWIKKQEKTTQEIQKQKVEYDNVLKTSKTLSEGLNNSFKAHADHLTSLAAEGKLKDALAAKQSQIGIFSKQELDNLAEKVNKQGISSDKMSEFTAHEKLALGYLTSSSKEIAEGANKLIETEAHAEGLRKELNETQKEVFSISEGFKNWSSKIGIPAAQRFLLQFDDTLGDIQKNTGIAMYANSEAFGSLIQNTSQFNIGAKEAGELMQGLGKELASTDFGVLAGATKDFAAVELATGASAENINQIGGELMRMGESSEQVKGYFESISKDAHGFGVSAKQAMSDIGRNIKKIRELGFVEGEKSLSRMILSSERLRMNVDEIFEFASKARTLQGSIEMAAELQLAAGSFARINPMDLLSAARQGPAQLQKILAQMGSDVGRFDKETGKYKFDPVDVDRLQIVAKATGVSMDSLQNMIAKNAEDNKKTHLIPDSMFTSASKAIKGLDTDMAKSEFADMISSIDDKGNVKISSDFAGAFKGVTNIKDISSDMLKTAFAQKEKDKKTLEDQAKANQSLTKTWESFKGALTSTLSLFEPVLKVLTSVLQKVTSVISNSSWAKYLFAGIALMIPLSMAWLKVARPLLSNVSGMAKAGGGGIKGLFKNIFSLKGSEKGMGEAEKIGGAGKGGFAKFAESMREGSLSAKGINLGGIAKLALAITILAAPLGIWATIFTKAGISPMMLLATAAALVGMAFSVSLMSKAAGTVNVGNVFKLALAMGIMSLAMVPFAASLLIFNKVEWSSLGKAAVALLGFMGIMAVVGLLAEAIAVPLMLGAAILVGVAATLALVGTLMVPFAKSMQVLQTLDSGALINLGKALTVLGVGFLAFGLSAMAFINPFTLLGLATAALALWGIAKVVAPLAESLHLGSDSITTFADGISRLADASEKLNLDKLKQLKEVADSLSGINTSSITNLANAMEKMSTTMGGGAGGGGRAVKIAPIEINLKMNGRDMQKIIVNDTKVLS